MLLSNIMEDHFRLLFQKLFVLLLLKTETKIYKTAAIRVYIFFNRFENVEFPNFT